MEYDRKCNYPVGNGELKMENGEWRMGWRQLPRHCDGEVGTHGRASLLHYFSRWIASCFVPRSRNDEAAGAGNFQL
ncbi:MAG: hypothetical protein LBU42_08260 [Prevotellaceae bacterium]|nr:hypothetical protein [Prevotellaceae bacterium]